MITCPVCSYKENSDAAVVCIKCGSELPDTRASLIKRPLITGPLSPDSVFADDRSRRRFAGQLTTTEIAVYVAEEEEAQLVNLTREVVLGRYGAKVADAATPVFDLTNFGAMEYGVSRKHALLRRLGSDIVIIDLESTNGTWLNGVQLNPNQPVMLKSSDKILLARLMLQIFLA